MKHACLCLMLSGVVLAGATGCSDAVSEPVAQAPKTTTAPLIGAWRTTVQFKSGALSDLHDLEFMYSFNEGGTLTQSSNYDGTPPVPPAYGVWRQTGPRTFELKYAFYSPPKFVKSGKTAAWVPTGRGLYTEKMEISADGHSYSSTIVYDCVGPNGAPVAGGGEGEAHGTRSTFESL
jgi:hypothetical protein